MSESGSLADVITDVKWRHDGYSYEPREPSSCDDYADLGEADLPPDTAVHLADMSGRPVEDFEADKFPIPDFEDQEVEFRD